ncbi:MAG: cyanophycinase [Planctomycetaceae bacterium]
MHAACLTMRRFLLPLCTVALLLTAVPVLEDDDDPPALQFHSVGKGTLVICGGGDISDEVLLQFVEAAGGIDARIVVVTTASETEDSEGVKEELDFWHSLDLAELTVLHTHSRETANDPEFAAPLAQATGIWFIGGNQAWLADTFLGTVSQRKIHDVFQRGGVVGGISAGAAVMSQVMIREGDTEPETGRGFGLLPGTVIDQHFIARNRQQRLMGALTAHPGMVGLGIDEGAAVVVRGRRLRVVGDADVVACVAPFKGSDARVQTMRPGAQLDLLALCQVARPSRHPRRDIRHAIVDAGAD